MNSFVGPFIATNALVGPFILPFKHWLFYLLPLSQCFGLNICIQEKLKNININKETD